MLTLAGDYVYIMDDGLTADAPGNCTRGCNQMMVARILAVRTAAISDDSLVAHL